MENNSDIENEIDKYKYNCDSCGYCDFGTYSKDLMEKHNKTKNK
jgi:hypothetical protein